MFCWKLILKVAVKSYLQKLRYKSGNAELGRIVFLMFKSNNMRETAFAKPCSHSTFHIYCYQLQQIFFMFYHSYCKRARNLFFGLTALYINYLITALRNSWFIILFLVRDEPEVRLWWRYFCNIHHGAAY